VKAPSNFPGDRWFHSKYGGCRGEHDLVQDLYQVDICVTCWVTKVQTLLNCIISLISYIFSTIFFPKLFSELIFKVLQASLQIAP